jgi:hypothetical protein
VTIIDCGGTIGEPHRAFKFAAYEGPDTVVEGFTVRNGYAPKERFRSFIGYSVGGAAYCLESSPTIRNCVIEDVQASSGGALMAVGGSPTLIDCVIRRARAVSDEHGVLHCETGGGLTLLGCTISGCATDQKLVRGLYDVAIVIDGCRLTGPAMKGVACGGDCALTVTNSIIGGGPMWYGVECFDYDGGNGKSPVEISNCLIYDCLYWCINCENCGLAVRGSCVVGESGNEAIRSVYSSSTVIMDSIVWCDSTYQIYPYNALTWTVAYCCIKNGSSQTWFDPATCTDADPLFVRGPLHDYYLSQVAAGQAVESPCVDAGSDTAANLGLDGLTTRVDGGRDVGIVDMGYHAPPAPYVTSITRSGDDVVIEWNGVAGMPYVVAWSDGWPKDAVTWNEVAVGAVETWRDVGVLAGEPAGTKRWYRVREDAAPPVPPITVEALSTEAGSAGPVSTGNGKRMPTAPLPGSSWRGPVRGGPNVRDGGNVATREVVQDGAGNVNHE